MAYCTIEYLKTLLPRSVTIGDNTITTPTITATKADTIATQTAWRFLNLATQYIDSRLRQIYVCPLRRIKALDMDLVADASTNNDYLQVYDSGHFTMDASIKVSDYNGGDSYTVNKIFDNDLHKIGVTPNLARDYLLTDNPKVYLIEYPDPIPMITAQVCIGLMFDKIFVAEQSPDISNYGKTQRSQASSALDDILTGVIRLEGQDHTGRRFARISLRDTYSNTAEVQHGRDRET
jgi:hypothetical protein